MTELEAESICEVVKNNILMFEYRREFNVSFEIHICTCRVLKTFV